MDEKRFDKKVDAFAILESEYKKTNVKRCKKMEMYADLRSHNY